jgi:hypothetical protein
MGARPHPLEELQEDRGEKAVSKPSAWTSPTVVKMTQLRHIPTEMPR